MIIYHVNADELDTSFLESLKTAFRHKQVQLAVREADETASLLHSPINRERLLRAVSDVENNRNIVEPDQKGPQRP